LGNTNYFFQPWANFAEAVVRQRLKLQRQFLFAPPLIFPMRIRNIFLSLYLGANWAQISGVALHLVTCDTNILFFCSTMGRVPKTFREV
jgi:hypothetical protein